MICYKLLWRNDDGALWSYLHTHLGKACTLYVPGEETYPACRDSRLFAFERFEDISTFGCSGSNVIWKCEALGEVQRLSEHDLVPSCFLIDPAKLWSNGQMRDATSPCIKGTILVEGLRLIKEVT